MIPEENSKNRPKYWLSLDQWRQDPEFMKFAETEFMSSPLRESDTGEGGWARREFLKLMGASMALASFGCIRRPAQLIVPYVQRPPEVIEGIPDFYASTFVDGSETYGIVVRCREGRPIHVTGNALHPINANGMSARAQAHVLSLYDPGRLNGPVKNLQNEKKTNHDTISVDWTAADKDITEQLKNGGVAILTSSLVSPSLDHLVGEFAQSTGAEVFVWDALENGAYADAQAASYGKAVVPRLVVDKARYILAVNNDFLGTWLQPTEQQRGFASNRKPGADMSKLVVFESIMTLTGANADQRYRIRATDSATVLMRIAHELLVNKKVSRYAGDAEVLKVVKGYAGQSAGIADAVYSKVADALWQNKGRSLILGGECMASQIAANLLNSVLENDGVTIDYSRSPNNGFKGRDGMLSKLIEKLNSGVVKTVIIHGVNPIYSAPAAMGFADALRKAKLAIYTGDRVDETGWYCDYVLPDHHPMESWSDAEGQKGVYSVQQPTIRPLYNTRGFGDSLLTWMKAIKPNNSLAHFDSYYAMVRSNIEKEYRADWVKTLQDGVINTVEAERGRSDSPRKFNAGSLKQAEFNATPQADFELVFYPTIGLRDGSMANVTWLQEFPDPVTKICWDNYLTISPRMSEEKKLQEGQVVVLQVGSEKLEVPIHIQPGQHDNVLGLAVGYGRSRVGEVGANVGVNAFPLVPVTNGRRQFAGVPAMFTATQSQQELPNVQGYYLMTGKSSEGANMGDSQIVVEATLAQWQSNPATGIEQQSDLSSWTPHEYKGHKWGMAVDLNLCTGCSACVIACQSENNISVVGKSYVLKRRMMHWIRIDRYFTGNASEPDSLHIPVMCQHCDNAPCETVCPVAATVHDDEGLNEMIYNRCVGTRYCSNNCPYKVRRFNWFNWGRMQPDLVASPMQMQLNPEVTVRERGVMEKCSLCTQRIKYGKMQAKLQGREVRDGEIQTACQASCPTNAIVFGDVNDPNSKVSQLLKDQRYYSLLVDLNTRPAVKYASKIRNTDKLKTSEEFYEGGHV